MACGKQARHTIQWLAEVSVVASFSNARVERHAHLDPRRPIPRLVCQGHMRFGSGSKCTLCGIERCAERIASGHEDIAGVPLYGLAQEHVVASECSPHRGRLALPE